MSSAQGREVQAEQCDDDHPSPDGEALAGSSLRDGQVRALSKRTTRVHGPVGLALRPPKGPQAARDGETDKGAKSEPQAGRPENVEG